MTNREKGRKLIDQAGQILKRDLTSALQAEDFNLAIRRAQEVIKLATKGALQILGVDYPKIHNVGAVLID